ncbi:MAG: cbb3-type cytochrome c oxidase subunit 3 [Wenzhouxiangella sp.]|jgi:cbb3-type cytochrome oxidase subunit 3|nr:cbb3-type cytochrome c oxidase subunit 3 [Wenzhouxiangella sp.]
MSSGIWTGFVMLAFIGIAVWVFLVKDKEDFDEQAHMPLDEEDTENRDHRDKESES